MSILDDLFIDYLNVGFQEHSYGVDGMSAAGCWNPEVQSLIWAGLNAPQGNFFTVGSFLGCSDVALGGVLRYRNANKLISIDIKHQRGWFRNCFQRAHLNDWIEPIDTSIAKYKHDGRPISLFFSDGWHSHRAIITEFNAIKDSLVKGAIYLFHDCPGNNILPNQSGPPPVHLAEDALARHDELMTSYIPETLNVENKSEYHASEATQDFLIELAIAKICHDTGAELIELPEFGHTSRIDRTGEPWRRGITSPDFSLRAIRL